MPLDFPDWSYGTAIVPRTALRPNQIPYFATIQVIVPARTANIFYIGKGYTDELEWIPENKRFSIWYVIFTIDQNSLIDTAVGAEKKAEPGTMFWVAARHGYGHAEYPAGIYFEYDPDTRPVYYIANYSYRSVVMDLTVFGIEEVIV